MKGRHFGSLALVCLALLAASPATGGEDQNELFQGRLRLAIRPFENVSSDSRFTGLAEGLPELLALALAENQRVQIIGLQEGDSSWIPGSKTGPAATNEKSADLVLEGKIYAYLDQLSIEANLLDLRTLQTRSIGSQVVTVERVFQGIDQLLSDLKDAIAAVGVAGRRNRIAIVCFRDDSAEVDGEFDWLRKELALSLVSWLEVERIEVLDWSESKEACPEADAISVDTMRRLAADAVVSGTYTIRDRMLTVVPQLRVAESPVAVDLTRATVPLSGLWDLEWTLAADVGSVLDAVAEADGRWHLGPLNFRSDNPLDYLERGRDYLFETGEYHLAALMLGKSLALDPDNLEGHYLLGVARDRQERSKEAIASYERALELDGDHVPSLQALGLARLEQGNDTAAVEALRRVRELAPELIEARRQLASAYELQGDSERAVAEYRAMLKLEPGNSATYLSLARALDAAGEDQEAENALLEALDIQPGDLELQSQLASLYSKRGREAAAGEQYEAAGSWFERAIALRNDPSDRGWLIFAFIRQEELEKAVAVYERAIAVGLTDHRVFNNGGYAYLRLGRYHEALGAFAQALEVDPELPQSLHGKGATLRSLGRYEEATTALQKALEQMPDNSQVLTELGAAAALAGQRELALETYSLAASAAPEDPWTHSGRAWGFNQLGLWEEAAEASRKAIDLQPDLANSHNHLGYALYKLGRRDEGLELIRRAQEMDKDYGGSYYNLARIAAEEGDFNRVVESLSKAIDLRGVYRFRAERDERFAAFRDDPEFEALLAGTE